MKRTLWAILEQEGGKYVIQPDIFEKAHLVNGNFDSVLNDDGSFTLTRFYDNETVEGEGKADERTS